MPFAVNHVGCTCAACERGVPKIIVLAPSQQRARAWAWDNQVNPRHMSVISHVLHLDRLRGIPKGLPYVWLLGPEDDSFFAREADVIQFWLKDRECRPWNEGS